VVLARERFGHDAVRANLDLADFFEDFAGNHAGFLIFNALHLHSTDQQIVTAVEKSEIGKIIF
jgi:hypothetical protein